jgi:hypothetical protein
MRPRNFGLFFGVFFLSIPLLASASDTGENFPLQSWTIPGTVAIEGAPVESRSERVWHVTFDHPSLLVSTTARDAGATAEQRPQAFTYSDGYNTRRKIHMLASYATIPLFVGQYVAGEKLADGDASETVKSVHGALAASVAALFAVNTVTGVWNLWEARQDPNGKTRRLVHGLLMLGADAGFVATGMMAPDDGEDSDSHRNVAIASMGVATASYLFMLFTR